MVAIYYRTIDGNVPLDAVTTILDYLWDEELKSYERNRTEGHTFERLVTIADWLSGGAGWTPLEYVYASRNGLGSGWHASSSCVLPWRRPGPEPKLLAELRHSHPVGYTLDVTEAAQAAGLECPVSVTVSVWELLIACNYAYVHEGEETNLSHLLGVVAKAYTGPGKDIFTWFHEETMAGEELKAIKALFVPGDEPSPRLTVMMSWEEPV